MLSTRQKLITAAFVLVRICAAAPETEAWRAQMDEANSAVSKRNFEAAKVAFTRAAAVAKDANDEAALLDATRKVAVVCRLKGEFAEAETALQSAVPLAVRLHGDNTEPVAAVLSELAGVQRAQRKLQEAMLTLDSCIRVRESAGSAAADRVRDLAALARTHQELEDTERAAKRWREALDLWDSAGMTEDSIEVLPMLDALAAIHRDKAEYDVAEQLLRRALVVREAIYGPESSDMISTVDSMAYVLFGQKKYVDAEPFYRRLLNIWKTSAGPEHPMVGLTLEKMAEFYAAQERYADAEPLVLEALTIRTAAHLRSLHQTGRVQLMQAKFTEADDLYTRAIRIGDEATMPDEFMDPLLRVHSQLLKELKRPAEAAKIDKRLKEIFLRNPNIRPSPVKPRAAQ